MPPAPTVSTEHWAVFIGMIICALGFIQFGEAIYKFLDITYFIDDADLRNEMSRICMFQVIFTAVSILLGVLCLFLWKADVVERRTLQVLAVFFVAAAGFGGFMIYNLYTLNHNNPNPKNYQEKLMLDRFQLIMFVDIALTVLLVAFGGLLVWLSRHYVAAK
jgi:hypothetical protein